MTYETSLIGVHPNRANDFQMNTETALAGVLSHCREHERIGLEEV